MTGTLSTINAVSGRLRLRALETVNVVLTQTGGGSWSVRLMEDIGHGNAYRTIATFTANTTGWTWKNESRRAVYLRLVCDAPGAGSIAYTVSDVTGDLILQEWTAPDGTVAFRITDRGATNPFTEQVWAHDHGAVGDGVTDDTAALQAAINAAGAYGDLRFASGTYACVGLLNTHIGQRWVGHGLVVLKKNGNGVILTGSAREQELHNVGFDGESGSYTGHNVVLSGDSPILHNCYSNDAAGRALLATGNHVQVLGGSGPYATADATASGYDIEIGVSGAATLYHRVQGIRSSQSTGGIKFVDCGSQTVTDSLFGKYTVEAGTSPAGVNGGTLHGCRVLGTVSIALSNSIVVGNAFGAVAFTYATGTSGHYYDSNVEQAGFTMVNDGNEASLIVRSIGAAGVIEVKYGDDASAATMKAAPGSGVFTFPQVEIPNNVNYRAMRASPNQASTAWTMGASVSDNFSHSVQVGSHQSSVPSGQAFQRIVNSIVKDILNASGHTIGDGTTSATPGGAVSDTRNVKAVTAIANAVATTVATITIPNGAHSCVIEFSLAASLGAGGAVGANEASAGVRYTVTIARTAGLNAVATISAAYGASSSAVAGAATITATLALGAVSGAVGATNTFAVQATISRGSGASTNHTATVMWEAQNANASGVTVA